MFPVSKRIKVGVGIVIRNLLLRGFSSLAKLVLVVYVVRQLSIEAFGIYTIFVICIDYGRQFIGLSFYVYLMREMSHFPRSEWPKLFQQQLWFHFLMGIMILPLSLLLFTFHYLPTDLLFPFLFLLPLEVLNVQMENYFVGSSKSNIASLVLFFRTGIWVYLVILFRWILNINVTLPMLLWFWIIAEAVTLVSGLLLLERYSLITWKRFSIDYKWVKRGALMGLRYFAISIMLVIVLTSSRLILQGYYKEGAVGVLGFFFSICSVAITLVQGSLMIFYIPNLLQLAADKQETILRRRFKELTVLSLGFAIFLFIGLSVMLSPMLDFIGRTALLENTGIFPLTILAALFFGMAQLPYYYLYVHKQDNALLKADSFSAIMSILLGFALIPHFGIWGGALALLCSIFILFCGRFVFVWRLWNVS